MTLEYPALRGIPIGKGAVLLILGMILVSGPDFVASRQALQIVVLISLVMIVLGALRDRIGQLLRASYGRWEVLLFPAAVAVGFFVPFDPATGRAETGSFRKG